MKILIVDDHPLVRKGILSALSTEDGIGEIFEASNFKESIDILLKKKISLAIVDLYLGKNDGLEIVKKAKERKLDTKFLILTSSIKKGDFTRANDMGVDGYVLKDAFAEDILYAIKVVLRGRQFIDPEIVLYHVKNDNRDDPFEELSPRENDVLMELAKGLSNYEIAQNLYISENTVKKHVSNILTKLDLSHRTQAALLVNSLGLESV